MVERVGKRYKCEIGNFVGMQQRVCEILGVYLKGQDMKKLGILSKRFVCIRYLLRWGEIDSGFGGLFEFECSVI